MTMAARSSRPTSRTCQRPSIAAILPLHPDVERLVRRFGLECCEYGVERRGDREDFDGSVGTLGRKGRERRALDPDLGAARALDGALEAKRDRLLIARFNSLAAFSLGGAPAGVLRGAFARFRAQQCEEDEAGEQRAGDGNPPSATDG